MADAQSNDQKPQPLQQSVWSGGAPVVRLANDQLPPNPKRVIRTFATDMNALQSGGKAVPVTDMAPTPSPKRPVPAPAPQKTLAQEVSGIRLPEELPPQPRESVQPGLPPVQKKPVPEQKPMYVQRPEAVPPPLPRPAPNPAPIREAVVYEKSPSFFTRIFYALFGARHAAPPPPPIIAPSLPYEPPPPVQAPAPSPATGVEPSIGSQIPSTASAEEAADRDAVLARLRARVSSYESERVPPPTFPTPPPAATARYTSSVPANLPGAEASPERIRTFSGDVDSETRGGRQSAFSILAAQADAPRYAQETTVVQTRATGRGLAYALAGTVLVVGGSLVLYFTFNYFVARSPVQVISGAPAGRITGDSSVTISGTGSGLMTQLANAANGTIPQGDIELVYLSVGTTTAGGGALINALQLPAPSRLLRNIDDDSSVGILHGDEGSRAFFVLSAPTENPGSSHELIFAGMLGWEPTIGQDLAQLYPSYPIQVQLDASGTPVAPVAPHFVDETVQSHDVRALKDGDGDTILLYGFRDQTTLIIARDETAFSILLARLSASQ